MHSETWRSWNKNPLRRGLTSLNRWYSRGTDGPEAGAFAEVAPAPSPEGNSRATWYTKGASTICLRAGFEVLSISRIAVLAVLDILRESNVGNAVDGIAPWSLVTFGIGVQLFVVLVHYLLLIFGGNLIRRLSCRQFVFVVLFQF